MSKSSTPILIDDRAGSKDLVKYPPLDTNPLVTLCHLDSGDVAITGNGPEGEVSIGVELKGFPDLISSIQSGRLQTVQIPAMLESYDVCWLLTYGEYRESRKEPRMTEVLVSKGRKLTWELYPFYGPKDPQKRPTPITYFESLIIELTALGIHHRHCRDMGECAKWISWLASWWGKEWSKHKALKVVGKGGGVIGDVRRPSLMTEQGWKESGMELKANVAARLQGVGQERAVAAARHFASVVEMVGASVEEWKSVEGFGKVTAESVVRQLRGE